MKWRNAALSAIVFLVMLTLTEMGLRLFYYPHLDPTATAIHRRSPDPELIYELTPGAVSEQGGIRIEINASGFRDDPFPGASRPREYRILVVGDSVASGFGVAMPDAFPQVLETLLTEEPPAGFDTVTVLNMGVYGYATRQELRLLTTRGLARRPNLVVVAYHLNDPDVADAGQARHFRHAPLALVDLAQDAWRGVRHLRDRREYHTRLHEDHAQEIAADFGRLGQLSRERGVPMVIAVIPVFRWSTEYPWVDIHHHLGELAEANDLGFIDFLPTLMAHPLPEVALDIWHPNEKGHHLMAEAIAGWVRGAALENP